MSYNNGNYQNNQVVTIDEVKPNILEAKEEFLKIAKVHNLVNFESECSFAIQHLSKNNHLLKVAKNNPASLHFAILNVANIGISLCPAKKQAYLVPRKNEVVLDISYMGLCHIAQEAGAVRWVQSKIVHENDDYQFVGLGEKPVHRYNSFKDRGKVIGVYCLVKTFDDEYLCEEMSIAEVEKIRNRSEGYMAYLAKKIKSNPWVTDAEEMIKKTVIKRAFKLWPKTDNSKRLSTAIDVINKHEGIDFEKENAIEMAKTETIAEIKTYLTMLGREEVAFLKKLPSLIPNCGEYESLEQMQQKDADFALDFLKDLYEKLKDAKEKADYEKQKQEKNTVDTTANDITANDIPFE